MNILRYNYDLSLCTIWRGCHICYKLTLWPMEEHKREANSFMAAIESQSTGGGNILQSYFLSAD